MKANWWDAPLVLQDLGEAISVTEFKLKINTHLRKKIGGVVGGGSNYA